MDLNNYVYLFLLINLNYKNNLNIEFNLIKII